MIILFMLSNVLWKKVSAAAFILVICLLKYLAEFAQCMLTCNQHDYSSTILSHNTD